MLQIVVEVAGTVCDADYRYSSALSYHMPNLSITDKYRKSHYIMLQRKKQISPSRYNQPCSS